MKPNWKVILPIAGAVIVAVSVTILLISVFKPTPKPDTKYFDLLLQEKDKAIKKEQDYRIETIEHYKEIIAMSQRTDSILQQRSKTNTIKYEKVPVVINAYTDDELRSAVADFNATH